MLPAGLQWPRALLDAETTAWMQILRAAELVPLRAGWSGIATGAPAAGLMRKAMAVLPEACALYFAHTEPVLVNDAIAHVSGEVQGLPVRALDDLPDSNGTQRLVLAPGFAACRSDLMDLDAWRTTWSGLTRTDDLLAFTLPAWADPALLEARWSTANPGARVAADQRMAQVLIEAPSGAQARITHLREADLPDWLAQGGFQIEIYRRVDRVLGVLARRIA